MGDRTCLFVESLRSDRNTIVQVLGDPAEEYASPRGPGAELLVFHDVNYGGTDHLAELAQSGLAFAASHDEGDGYGGMTFAACDHALAEVPSPRGEIRVRIDETTLEPNAEEMAAFRRWRDIRDRVRAILAAAAPPADDEEPPGG